MLRSAALAMLVAWVGVAAAAGVTVDVTPGHRLATVVPLRALGAGVDAVPGGATDQIYTPANIAQMLAAGFGPVSYRLFTELGVQAWHWNPSGTWRGPGDTGYFTGGASGGPIRLSFACRTAASPTTRPTTTTAPASTTATRRRTGRATPISRRRLPASPTRPIRSGS